jgi:hypothetical protein
VLKRAKLIASGLGVGALLWVFLLIFPACSSGPSKSATGPYQYRDLPEQPNDFISAPQDPREHQPDAASAMAQWAASTDRSGQQTHQPHISGTCVIHSGKADQNTGEDLGCVRVTLILTDSHGNEVDRQITHKSGRFEFVVSPGSKYTIKPLSAQYSPEFDKPGPYSAGDVLSLKLLIK